MCQTSLWSQDHAWESPFTGQNLHILASWEYHILKIYVSLNNFTSSFGLFIAILAGVPGLAWCIFKPYDLTWPIPPFSGVPFNLCLIKFSQKCTVMAARTSRTTLWPPPTLGVEVPEQNVSYNLPGVDVVLHAKFQLCRSNGVVATHTFTFII